MADQIPPPSPWRRETPPTLYDAMGEALDHLELQADTSGQHESAYSGADTPTGFADMDQLTGGFHSGHLIVIGGRTGVGTSTLALDLVRSCSIRNGLAACLFTLEATRQSVSARILSAESRVALHHIQAGRVTDEEWAKLKQRSGEVASAPLYIQDKPDLTLGDIERVCRKLVDQHALRVAVIDSVSRLRHGGRQFRSWTEEATEVSRCLKLLAKELGIAIVAVCKLSRAADARPRRPHLHDLRDTGAWEDNADIVILVHREDQYERESPRAGEADLIVAKHRMGPTATITVAHQEHFSRFVDMAQN